MWRGITRTYILLILLLYIIIATSCVEKYWPDLPQSYVNALVVDGVISDKPGPYTVKLSLSSEVQSPQFNPLADCNVIIEDNQGNSETLTEHEKGVYETSPNGIHGQVGNSYKLIIIKPDGTQYETDFQELPISTEIESVYAAIEYQRHPYYQRNMTGFRFFIDTYTSEVDVNYYLWDLECTYKFNANYRIKYYFDGAMHQFSNSDSLYTCFKTSKIRQIFIYNTEQLSIPRITEYPLHYVTTETKELSIRYSLFVSQYSISKKAYEFWKRLTSIEDDQGELHSRQPYQVRGNVYNIKNSDEAVLGYFMVAGVSEKRIFMDRPTGVDWHYADSCNLYPPENIFLYANVDGWPLYLTAVYFENGQSPAYVDYQWCLDCTAKGADGYLEEPDFWEE